jgi:hypothetical protein
MITNSETLNAAVMAVPSMVSMTAIIENLNALVPDAEALMAKGFEDAFPAIQAAESRGIPAKQIIESLKQAWPNLHHATYRKHLDLAQKAYIERGQLKCCDECHRPLPLEMHREESDAPIADGGES